jgi:hypothetical protein
VLRDDDELDDIAEAAADEEHAEPDTSPAARD